MRKKVVIISIFVLFFIVNFVYAQELNYTHRVLSNAPLKESPELKSQTLLTVNQGSWVVATGKVQNGFMEVITEDGKKGWIFEKLLEELSEDFVKSCKNVEGFSALCPVKKELPIKGELIEDKPDKIGKLGTKSMLKTPNLPVGFSYEEQLKEGDSPNDKSKQSGKVTKENKIEQGNKEKNILINDEENYDKQLFESLEKTSGLSPVVVEPDKTKFVQMSSMDINRVYCLDGDITDVVFSDEKGVRVKASGNNAFVKFTVKKVGDVPQYLKSPVDIFFVCNGKVYSIIAQPMKIPSTLTYLQDKKVNIKEVVSKTKEIPFEKRITEIIRNVYVNKPEPHYNFVKVNKKVNYMQNVDIEYKGYYIVEGEGLQVKIFTVEPKNITSVRDFIEINEKDFLNKVFTSYPVAISLDKTRLNRKDKAVLIILEKRREHE
ncbi:MAG: type-F conjugative transfer system secretin TraK [Candidatus Micrarchaeia archaeon]